MADSEPNAYSQSPSSVDVVYSGRGLDQNAAFF